MTLLLLDFDGVVRRIGPDAPIEDAHGLPRGTLATVAFSLSGPALVGRMSDEEWRAAVRAHLAGLIGPTAAADAVTAWTRTGEVVPEALALVRAARTRATVALLSNATTKLDADLAALGLTDEFDAVVASFRLGAVKPDPECFTRTLDLLGHKARDTVFCDDNADNAAGARAVGIGGVHTPDTATLAAALRERGLVD
ncbi:HAD-IA family hydrolase [Saccharothrix variisporea]|uniref:Putative hydrolase of the HAD superfamily n=1 Tax=Saccharothrix variisporea TaxID=543527 RepID=A0A495XGN4_9PSEU|nr:HAD-IA family hydrolase [Saccharothrix variisporea]RKT72356.1 putative hydrolase of the HAD superfamily [Saccharothrix variisporea]